MMDSEGWLQLHHVVFETRLYNVIVLVAFIAKTFPGVLAHAVQRQHLDARQIFFTASKHHPAFAGRDVLGRVETETTEVAEGAGFAAVIFRFDSVRAVLD